MNRQKQLGFSFSFLKASLHLDNYLLSFKQKDVTEFNDHVGRWVRGWQDGWEGKRELLNAEIGD